MAIRRVEETFDTLEEYLAAYGVKTGETTAKQTAKQKKSEPEGEVIGQLPWTNDFVGHAARQSVALGRPPRRPTPRGFAKLRAVLTRIAPGKENSLDMSQVISELGVRVGEDLVRSIACHFGRTNTARINLGQKELYPEIRYDPETKRFWKDRQLRAVNN